MHDLPKMNRSLFQFRLIHDARAVILTCGSLWAIFVAFATIGFSLPSDLGRRVRDVFAKRLASNPFSEPDGDKFRRIYLENIYTQHRYLGAHNVELQDVFVEMAITPAPKQDSYSIWQILANSQTHRLVMIGPTGSGKSTLLQHIALTLAGYAKPLHPKPPKRLPILLFLRDHAQQIVDNPDLSLAELLHASPDLQPLNPPDHWFDDQLKAGKCLVMLDGLDEIADPATRTLVAQWVLDQVGNLGHNSLIVTSRPVQNGLVGSFDAVELQPFSPAQIQQFIQNWYAGSADLLATITLSPDLAELAANPLLLTMLATIHRSHGTLPHRRVELYAMLCEALLQRLIDQNLLGFEITPAELMGILQGWAYASLTHSSPAINLTSDSDLIARPIQHLRGQISPAAFLKAIEHGSAILHEREDGEYAFAHPTFQAYLAAVHIQEHGLENTLIEHLDDAWWHATIRLYCAMNGGAAIIAKCLPPHPPNADRFALAVQCKDEIPAQFQPVRDAIEATIVAYSESQDKALWMTAADATLKSRLQGLNNATYLDASSITHVEYQLFLDEHPDYAPDHWPAPHFKPGTATQPIVGLTPFQAKGFLQWLTDAYGGGWQFRLPHQAEVREAGTFWVADGYDCKLATDQCLDERTVEAWNIEATPINPALQSRLVRICYYNVVHPLAFTAMLALDRARDHIQALAPNRDDIFALDLALIHALVYDLDRTLAHAHARQLTRALAGILGRDRVSSLDRAYVRDLVQALSEEAPTPHHYPVAQMLLDYLELASLLAYASPIFVIDRTEGLSAYREQLLRRANDLLTHEPPPVNRGDNSAWEAWDRAIDLILQTYAMLVMLEKRRSGEWEAFEELRIVKARRTENDPS